MTSIFDTIYKKLGDLDTQKSIAGFFFSTAFILGIVNILMTYFLNINFDIPELISVNMIDVNLLTKVTYGSTIIFLIIKLCGIKLYSIISFKFDNGLMNDEYEKNKRLAQYLTLEDCITFTFPLVIMIAMLNQFLLNIVQKEIEFQDIYIFIIYLSPGLYILDKLFNSNLLHVEHISNRFKQTEYVDDKNRRIAINDIIIFQNKLSEVFKKSDGYYVIPIKSIASEAISMEELVSKKETILKYDGN